MASKSGTTRLTAGGSKKPAAESHAEAPVLNGPMVYTPGSLKTAFGQQSVPVQEDFHALIDLVAEAASVIRMTDSNESMGGLALDQNNQLAVDCGDGLLADSGGLRVNYAPDQFSVHPSGDAKIIIAKAGNGLFAGADTTDVLQVHCLTGSGLTADADGVKVNHGTPNGTTSSEAGLGLVLDGRSLKFSQDGLSVSLGIQRIGAGLYIYNGSTRLLASSDHFGQNSLVIAVVALWGNEFVVTANPLRVNGNGLTVLIDPADLEVLRGYNDMGYLALKNSLPAGSMVMFAGDTPPEKWRLCDGENGTTDMRSSFVKDVAQTEASGRDRYSLIYITPLRD